MAGGTHQGPFRPNVVMGTMTATEEFDARPVRACLPGPGLLELGPWGMWPAAWEDLSLVIAWRQFMRDPRSYFRHLFEEL